MDKLSFGNLTTNTQNISPQMQQRLESGENFTAIDKEKLKQDTVEITQNAVKENFVFKILRNTFGVKDPKKFLTSLGLTTVTVIGFATAGNMSVKKMTQLGLNVDEILGKNGLYQSITSFFKKGTDGIGNFFKKFKTVNDVVDTLKNKMVKPIQQFAKGTGQGIKIQFAYTIPDVLEALPLKAQGDTYKNLRKALGSKGKAIKFITAAAQEGADQAQLTKQLADRIGDSAKAKQLMDDVFKKNMQNFDAFSKAAKIPSTLMIVPSAGYIMEDKLPAFCGKYRDDELFKIASELTPSVNFLDVRGALYEKYCDGQQVYYKTDHHLTSAGSYVIYKEFCKNVGTTPPAKEAYSITEHDGFYGTTYSGSGYFLSAADKLEIWDLGEEVKVTLEEKDSKKEWQLYCFPQNRINLLCFWHRNTEKPLFPHHRILL